MSIAVLNDFSVEAVRDALEKLDSFAGLKVNGLNAFQLNELKSIDPELFGRVEEKIKADRWFPFAGAWTDTDEMSETALIKSCLYSVRYFLDKFGKKYRVFHGEKLYNNRFPQIVYSSLFDAAVLDNETESKWVQGADNFRTLVIGVETTDVTDMDDDFIKENEFISYEELADKLFESSLNLETDVLPKDSAKPQGIEKQLIDAERAAALGGKDIAVDVRFAWIAHLGGDDTAAEKLVSEIDICVPTENDITVHGDGVEISEVKTAEDGSGDIVIRVTERDGKEHSAYVMYDKLSAGFRFESMPYEIQTFRIGADSYVKEIYICE